MTDQEIQRPPTIELEWIATYNDGSELKQNYEKENEHHFGHIDQERLTIFRLVNKEGKPIAAINIKDQKLAISGGRFFIEFPRDKDGNKVKGKLVYFRRVRNDFTPNGIIVSVRYCLGLQANIDGKNYQQYVFINNDGTFTLSQQK